MRFFQIFNASIPALWIAVIVASILATFFYRIIQKEKVTDWFWQAFFMYIIVWKFSYIVFNFSGFITFPMSALYFNGGIRGHFIALFVIVSYLLLYAPKKYVQLPQQIVAVSLLYIASLEAVFQWLHAHYFFAVIQTSLVVAIAVRLKWNQYVHTQIIVLFLMLELLLLTIQQSLTVTNTITYSAIIAVALFYLHSAEDSYF